jgi:hypothetical protein
MKREAWKDTDTPLGTFGGENLSTGHNLQIATFIGIGTT